MNGKTPAQRRRPSYARCITNYLMTRLASTSRLNSTMMWERFTTMRRNPSFLDRAKTLSSQIRIGFAQGLGTTKRKEVNIKRRRPQRRLRKSCSLPSSWNSRLIRTKRFRLFSVTTERLQSQLSKRMRTILQVWNLCNNRLTNLEISNERQETARIDSSNLMISSLRIACLRMRWKVLNYNLDKQWNNANSSHQ